MSADPIAQIRNRWRARELVREWQKLSSEARNAVIGELEESARTCVGDEAQALLVAADALDAMQSSEVFQGIDGAIDDVGLLLAEVDRLRRLSP